MCSSTDHLRESASCLVWPDLPGSVLHIRCLCHRTRRQANRKMQADSHCLSECRGRAPKNHMKKPARSASGTFHSVARRAGPNDQVDGGVINGKSGLFLEVVLRQTLSKRYSKKIPVEATRSPGHESMARQPQLHSRKNKEWDSNVDGYSSLTPDTSHFFDSLSASSCLSRSVSVIQTKLDRSLYWSGEPSLASYDSTSPCPWKT